MNIKILSLTLLLLMLSFNQCTPYACHPKGGVWGCCENNGLGPLCDMQNVHYPKCQPGPTCTKSGQQFTINDSVTFPLGIDFILRKYQSNDGADTGKFMVTRPPGMQLGVPKNDWINDKDRRSWMWQIDLKVKVITGGVSTCSGDGSSYGEVNLNGEITMNTSLIYDLEFCTIGKITDNPLQSNYFKVKVVDDCSTINCSLSTLGQFLDWTLDNKCDANCLVVGYSQFFKIIEGEIPAFNKRPGIFYTNQCCLSATDSNGGMTMQLSVSDTTLTPVAGIGEILESVIKDSDITFKVDDSEKYVPHIYQFYIYYKTVNHQYIWANQLLFTVVCGDQLGGGYEKGRTKITVDQPFYNTSQYIPSSFQTSSALTEIRWGFKLPIYVSSNIIDCKILEITVVKRGGVSWNKHYTSSDWNNIYGMQQNALPGANGDFDHVLISDDIQSEQYYIEFDLNLHLGITEEHAGYFPQNTGQYTSLHIYIGCFHRRGWKYNQGVLQVRRTDPYYASYKEAMEIQKSFNSVSYIPVGQTLVYKAYFPKFAESIYYCSYKQNPDFMVMSDAQWWDTYNDFAYNSNCRDKQITDNQHWKKNCWTPFAKVPNFQGQDFLKIDYSKCTTDYCPVVFDRDQPNRINEFWMDQNVQKNITILFRINYYIETDSSSDFTYIDTRLHFGCNYDVIYKIASSLLGTTSQSRTIDLFLDEIPNQPQAFFEFDDFECNPNDCCFLDYAVVDDLNSTALVNSTTEVELIRSNLPGKNQLNFKNNQMVYTKTYYVFAKTSLSSINSTLTNMVEMELNQYIPIIITTSCRPGIAKIVEAKYPGDIEGNVQVTGTGNSAKFILPTFKISNPVCKMIKLEILNMKNQTIQDLIVKVGNDLAIPKNKLLEQEYNFIIKATISGGDFVITSNKTLRVNDTIFSEQQKQLELEIAEAEQQKQIKENQTNSSNEVQVVELTQQQIVEQNIELLKSLGIDGIQSSKFDFSQAISNPSYAFLQSEEYKNFQHFKCEEVLEFITSTQSSIRKSKLDETILEIILWQQPGLKEKLEIKNNLDWQFKFKCIDMIFRKLCKDKFCTQISKNSAVYLNGEFVIVDRTNVIDEVFYLQIQTNSDKETYVISFRVNVVKRVNPFAQQGGIEDSLDSDSSSFGQGLPNSGTIGQGKSEPDLDNQGKSIQVQFTGDYFQSQVNQESQKDTSEIQSEEEGQQLSDSSGNQEGSNQAGSRVSLKETAQKIERTELKKQTLVLVQYLSGEIINGDYSYISPKLSLIEANLVSIEVDIPSDLKVIKAKVIDNRFFKLNIAKEDFQIGLKGQYFIMVVYTFRGSGRSIFKSLELNIKSIQQFQSKQLEENNYILENDDKTFDGVDQNQILAALKKRQKLKEEGQYDQTAPMVVSFNPITVDGKMTLEFSQDHLVPETKMQQFEYDELFLFDIQPQYNDKIGYGSFSNSRRQLRNIGDEKLNFNVEVLQHEPRFIMFQLIFSHANLVSNDKKWDLINVVFLKPSLFRQKKDFKTFKNSSLSLSHYIPPQLQSKKQVEEIKEAAGIMEKIVRLLQAGTIFTGLLRSSVLKQLWASIRGLQMAVYPALCNIDYPAKNLLLLTILITFANMDPFVSVSETYVIPLIPLHETNAFNQQFEQFDIETQNYIQNSGAFILMISSFWIWILVKKVIHEVCKYFRSSEWACVVGQRFYVDGYMNSGVIYQSKMIIEAYIDFSIMTILSINSFLTFTDLRFYDTFWNATSSVLTILTAMFLVLYPVYGTIGIIKNLDALEDECVKKQFGILYEEQRYNTLHQALFGVYGMLRKLLMVLIFTVFKDYPYFQISFLIQFSIINLSYISAEKPFVGKSNNWLERIGESLIYIIVLTNMAFQFSLSGVQREYLGTIQFVLYFLMIICNISYLLTTLPATVMVYIMSKAEEYAYTKQKFKSKKTQVQIQNLYQKVKRKNKLTGKLQQEVDILSLNGDLDFCIDYLPLRIWLIKINDDGLKLRAKEIRYQKILLNQDLVYKTFINQVRSLTLKRMNVQKELIISKIKKEPQVKQILNAVSNFNQTQWINLKHIKTNLKLKLSAIPETSREYENQKVDNNQWLDFKQKSKKQKHDSVRRVMKVKSKLSQCILKTKKIRLERYQYREWLNKNKDQIVKEQIEIKSQKNLRIKKQQLSKKFVPFMNQIFFYQQSLEKMKSLIGIQIEGAEPLPPINPYEDFSDQILLEYNELENVNKINEEIKSLYSEQMVEVIHMKLRQLHTLNSQDQNLELPQGSMLEMMELLNKKSKLEVKFDKSQFFQELKYGKRKTRKNEKTEILFECDVMETEVEINEESDQSPEQRVDELKRQEDFYFQKVFLEVQNLPESQRLDLEYDSIDRLIQLGYEDLDVVKMTIINRIRLIHQRKFELFHPNKIIDVNNLSIPLFKTYQNDTDIHLIDTMNYNQSIVVHMSLEDKLQVIMINKRDKVINEKEEFENLTSYETESIKSETAYKLKLELVEDDPVSAADIFQVRNLDPMNHPTNRITWPEMIVHIQQSLVDEALGEHNRNIYYSIDIYNDQEEDNQIQELNREIEMLEESEFSFKDPLKSLNRFSSSSSSSSSQIDSSSRKVKQ